MRRKSKMKSMRLGQTIVAEREWAESESDRMLARKKIHRKQTTSVIIVILLVAVLGVLAYLGIQQLSEKQTHVGFGASVEEIIIKAQIVDEDNRGQISARTKEYIARLEQDFRDLGYEVTKVTLPTGVSRDLYVDLAGKEMYFKVNVDRDAAVSAEDAERMIRYLEERDLHPSYVDVRIEGKAYYK